MSLGGLEYVLKGLSWDDPLVLLALRHQTRLARIHSIEDGIHSRPSGTVAQDCTGRMVSHGPHGDVTQQKLNLEASSNETLAVV